MPEFSDKAEARRWARAAMRAIGTAELSRRGAEAAGRAVALDEFRQASLVLLFLSMPAEIDTAPLAAACLAAGKRAAAPLIAGDEIEFVELSEGWRSWPRDALGIPAPPPGARAVPLADIVDTDTFALIPGLLFDRGGGRLGRGRGYYDRFLGRTLAALADRRNGGFFAPAGFCLSAQIVERVPSGPGDIRVPRVVTDAETIVAE